MLVNPESRLFVLCLLVKKEPVVLSLVEAESSFVIMELLGLI